MSLDPATSVCAPTQISTPTAPALPRYHSLDALRAVALLLGIVLHAALAYIPGPGLGWAIQDPSTNLSFGAMVVVIHSFRLEVFFVIAGFFARLVVIRRGIAGFARNRLLRILIPFVAGWFLVAPGLVFAWTWGASKGDPAAIPAAMKAVLPAMVFQLLSFANGGFLRFFMLTHLWFLYYLMLIYLLFFMGRVLVKRLCGSGEDWKDRTDKTFAAVISSKWAIGLLGIVTWLMLMTMNGWGVDTPDKTLLPHIPALLVYGLAFTIGWLFHRQTRLLENVADRWKYHALLALLLVPPALVLCTFEWSQPPVAYKAQIRAAYQALCALMMWSWALVLLGFFTRFLRGESRFWRYLSDSSYWVYIVHLPIMVTLQVGVSRLPVNCWIKFSIVSAVTMIIALVSYHCLVRSTPIGFVLNGRRHPFQWVPWRKPGAG